MNRQKVEKLHNKLADTPFMANRTIAVLSSIYTFARSRELVPDGIHPTQRLDKFSEHERERFLTDDELDRLGSALREGETKGIPWDIDQDKPTAKHLAARKHRFTKIDPFAAAAIRLLIFTGCRLREILHLKWDSVDIGRFLPDSKTGKRGIVLNAPALAILAKLPRIGDYVIAGQAAGTDADKPRADLKRPWQTVAKRAGLEGARIHDLRHTHASVGVGAQLGLPIIGKLLGHARSTTTERYAIPGYGDS